MTKIATLLIMLAVLSGSLGLNPVPSRAAPPLAASGEMIPRAYLPLVSSHPPGCAPISGVSYDTLDVNGDPTDRPAHLHADLNLALRGYEITSAYLGLVYHYPMDDPKAPQLYTLFSDHRVPNFATAYQVYQWDWGCNCRGDLADDFPMTVAGMGVTPGELIYPPASGYDIGSGYEVLVLYATEERITLKYTRDDNVVNGYTIHIENICVEPKLLALYRDRNAAGRADLPALRDDQPLGYARSSEIGVGIRDCGMFMDPRSGNEWWQGQ